MAIAPEKTSYKPVIITAFGIAATSMMLVQVCHYSDSGPARLAGAETARSTADMGPPSPRQEVDALRSEDPAPITRLNSSEEILEPSEADAVDGISGLHRLSEAETAHAIKMVDRFLRHSEGDYQKAVSQHPEDPNHGLRAAMAVVKNLASRRMLEQGKAWAFIDPSDANKAWRKIPRGWKKVLISNAATTTDGRGITIVFPLNPAEHPDIRPIQQEMELLEEQRDKLLIGHFNSLLLDERRRRIRMHDAALRELKSEGVSGLPRSAYEKRRRKLKEDLLRGRFSIDRDSYLLVPH